MPTTTQIRSWWSPACVGPFTKVALYGKGVVAVRGDIVDAVHALSTCLERHKYATRAGDTGAYNCRKITGGSGYSLHAYGVALDINWSTNPYGRTLVTDMPPAMVKAIKAIRTRNGKQVWRWGGDYVGNKDAMHFEVVCHPADLTTGIDPSTLPQSQPTPPIATEEDDLNKEQDAALAEILGLVRVSLKGPSSTIAKLKADVAALGSAVSQLGAGGTVDYGRVQEAAEAAVESVLKEGTG